MKNSSHTPETTASLPVETLLISDRPEIFLQLIRPEDAPEFYQMLLPGGANLDEYQYWDKGFSPETVQAELERSAKEIADGRMLRYLITPSFEGKGIASAASRALLDYGIERWELHKVLLEIEVDNASSEGLAGRLGAHPTDKVDHVQGGGKQRDLRTWEITV